MNIPTDEQWEFAEQRAADARVESVNEYARKLLADPERLTDALYERMAYVGSECSLMCKRVSHLLVTGSDPSKLLATIAAEEAEDCVPYYDAEKFLTDDEDNDE